MKESCLEGELRTGTEGMAREEKVKALGQKEMEQIEGKRKTLSSLLSILIATKLSESVYQMDDVNLG